MSNLWKDFFFFKVKQAENFKIQHEGIGGPLEEADLSQLVKLGDKTSQQLNQLKEVWFAYHILILFNC